MHCGVFSSIAGLYSQDASSIPPFPPRLCQPKMYPHIDNFLGAGGKSPQAGATAMYNGMLRGIATGTILCCLSAAY